MKLRKLSFFAVMSIMAAFLSIGLNSCGNEAAAPADATEVVAETTADAAAKCGEGKCGEGKCGDAKENAEKVDRFASIDTDGDGNITQTEFDAAGGGQFAKNDVDANGDLSKDECKMFDKFNADGDEVVSQDEFLKGRSGMFSKMDANADGSVTREEMDAAMASMAPKGDAAAKCGEGKCGEGKCGK